MRPAASPTSRRPTRWPSTRSGAASRRPTSPTAQGATSARTRATSIVSACTSCSRSLRRSSSSSWSTRHATPSSKRDRRGHVDAARRSPASGRGRRHHDQRRAPKRLHLLRQAGTRMPKFSYVAIDPSGAQVKGMLEAAERGARRRAISSGANFAGVRVKERKSLCADRDHRRRSSSRRTSWSSAGRWRRSCAPASRFSTRSRCSATTLRTSSCSRCSIEVADALRAGRTFADAMAVHSKMFPTLLRRHPALGGAHRQPRHRPRAARQLHRARPRDDARDQVGAALSIGDPGDVDRHRDPAGLVRAAEVQDVLQELRREAAAPDPDAAERRRLLRRVRAGRPRSSSVAVLIVPGRVPPDGVREAMAGQGPVCTRRS